MNTYIKPEIKIQNVVVEQLLASESGGQGHEWLAKPNNDFWANDEDEANELSINDVWE